MNWNPIYRGIFLSIVILCCGLSSNAQKNLLGPVPALKFLSCSSAVTANQDSIQISIAYTDGDGDLGENDPDTKNLFVIDERNGMKYSFRVQQLYKLNESAAIKGKLNIFVDKAMILNPEAESEEIIYTLYMKDRAGNESNHIQSKAIKVKNR